MQSVADVTFNIEHSGSKVVVFDPLLSDLVFASTNNNDDIHFTIQLGQDKGKCSHLSPLSKSIATQKLKTG